MTPHGDMTVDSYRAMRGTTKRCPICRKSLVHMVASASYALLILAFDAWTSRVVTSIGRPGALGTMGAKAIAPIASAPNRLRHIVMKLIRHLLPDTWYPGEGGGLLERLGSARRSLERWNSWNFGTVMRRRAGAIPRGLRSHRRRRRAAVVQSATQCYAVVRSARPATLGREPARIPRCRRSTPRTPTRICPRRCRGWPRRASRTCGRRRESCRLAPWPRDTCRARWYAAADRSAPCRSTRRRDSPAARQPRDRAAPA